QHPDHIRRDEPIPVTIVPLADIVAGEWAENDPQLRKDFTPSETVAIVRALRPVMASAARERQREAGRSKASVKFTEAEKGDAREKVARATGKSWRSIEKMEAIEDAAERDPERFGRLRENMNKTGRVDGPFKQLRTLKASAEIRKAPPPAPGQGPY